MHRIGDDEVLAACERTVRVDGAEVVVQQRARLIEREVREAGRALRMWIRAVEDVGSDAGLGQALPGRSDPALDRCLPIDGKPIDGGDHRTDLGVGGRDRL